MTWSTKNRTSAQARALQSVMQLNEKAGGIMPLKSKQPKMQVATSMHVTPGQVPQSPGQLVQLSNSEDSHIPFPQNEHTPQSAEQLAQSSVREQRPSPQPMH
jgi:hypothetical protein